MDMIDEILIISLSTIIIFIIFIFVFKIIPFLKRRDCTEIVKAKFTSYQKLTYRDEYGDRFYSHCVISCKFNYNNKKYGGQTLNNIRLNKAKTLTKGQEIVIKINPQNPNRFIHCIK